MNHALAQHIFSNIIEVFDYPFFLSGCSLELLKKCNFAQYVGIVLKVRIALFFREGLQHTPQIGVCLFFVSNLDGDFPRSREI